MIKCYQIDDISFIEKHFLNFKMVWMFMKILMVHNSNQNFNELLVFDDMVADMIHIKNSAQEVT